MKKEHHILVIFLAIVIISAGVVYVMKTPQAEISAQTQGLSNTANVQSELQARIATLEAMVAEDPNNLNILIDLGNSYYDVGDPAKSIEYYEKSLEIKPDNPPILVDCGTMYRESGQPLKALELFNKAIEVNPNFPQAYFNKGTVLRMELGDQEGAARAWKKYLQIDQNVDPQIKNLLIGEIEAASGSQ